MTLACHRLLQLCCFFALMIALSACSGTAGTPDRGLTPGPAGPGHGPDAEGGWPIALPVDLAQPWDAASAARGAQALTPGSEIAYGADRFSEGGSVADHGAASTLSSGPGSLSYAIYRLQLDGAEPGLITVDLNLLSGSYFVALADYGAGTWDWHGPFSDHHVRLSIGQTGGDYTSELGGVFICVAVWDGSAGDVVALGAEPADPGDTIAPPAPTAPTVSAVNGALELSWLPVAAGDLAGYRVYFGSQWFLDAQGAGARMVDSLEGLTMHLLDGLSGETFVRLAAVDVSGNESGLSPIVSATPLAAVAPALQVTVSAPDGGLNDTITLTASGANTYDYDTDGDGLFDLTGDETGMAVVDTAALGIIRPRVRGYNAGGTAVALGGASVVIAGNSRPVANAGAEPAQGSAPLSVAFSGAASTDFDGALVGGGWDFDGDGVFDVWDDNDLAQVEAADHLYSAPGLYNAKLRVVDDSGAWDVDTVAILVTPDQTPPENAVPAVALAADRTKTYVPFLVHFDASASADGDGTIELYEWDFDGDGAFDSYGTSPTASHVFTVRGQYRSRVRVTDDLGASAVASLTVTLPTEWAGYSRSVGHSGQSPYVGAQTSAVRWPFDGGGAITSSPVIAVDGTVYFGVTGGAPRLYAVRPNGTEKWYLTVGAIAGAPALADDGTIYFGSSDTKLYALNPNGSTRWSVSLGGEVFGGPCVGPDGMVYAAERTSGSLYAVFPDGKIRWGYSPPAPIWSTPAVGPDGTVYVTTLTDGLHAVSSDGSFKWKDDAVGDMRSSPAVSPDGIIYVGDENGILYSFNPDGSLNWPLSTAGAIRGAPSFGADGTVYFCCLAAEASLYAVSPAGDVLWSFPTAGEASSSPAIGADGTVYFGSSDHFVYAVSPGGTELWSYETGMQAVESSPAIASDGTVYIGSGSGNLFAFGTAL